MYTYQSPFQQIPVLPTGYGGGGTSSLFPQLQPQNQSGIKFVNGIDSAKQYYMPPNAQEILMDQNQDIFYIKRTDASGQYTIQSYSFAPITEKSDTENLAEIQSEIKNLNEKIQNIENRMSENEFTNTESQSKSKRTKSTTSTT